jgi:hypothetical protein
VPTARYSVLVHRAAALLHASFRPRLATTPSRFANPSPPSGWIEDFHLQAVDHARHTRKAPRQRGLSQPAVGSSEKAPRAAGLSQGGMSHKDDGLWLSIAGCGIAIVCIVPSKILEQRVLSAPPAARILEISYSPDKPFGLYPAECLAAEQTGAGTDDPAFRVQHHPLISISMRGQASVPPPPATESFWRRPNPAPKQHVGSPRRRPNRTTCTRNSPYPATSRALLSR